MWLVRHHVDVWADIANDVAAVARGDDGAWGRLLAALAPELEAIARSAPIGRLRGDVDAQRDVIAAVIAKLHRDDHAVLKKLVAQPDPPPLQAWMRLLVRRAAIDVMRGRPEFVRGGELRAAGWLSLATLATRDGAEPPSSLAQKRREVEQFVARAARDARAALEEHGAEAATKLASAWQVGVVHTRRLIKRIDDYEGVLAMILAGHTHAEIATHLGRTVREVELVVSYLEELCHARGFAA
jgi:DNA-directed RNA polymerase specialized sigma24 family protein